MKRPWMDIIERGGDRNLGQALLRLARQSAAVHMAESAEAGCTDQVELNPPAAPRRTIPTQEARR